jgi:uncharacterized protein
VSTPAGAKPIRANSILPARRTPLTLTTADGLSLVGEVAVPLGRDPIATLICLHPLPTHGGMMDSQIYRKAAARLPALADIAVLRFNSRGTESVQGRSEGEFHGGVGERYDVAAAVERAEFDDLPDRWLVGWSFGSDLVLKYGLEPGVVGGILLSPSLRFSTPDDLARWADDGRPLLAIVPEFDDYLRPAAARERLVVVPQAEVVGVPKGRHLWVGQAETVLDLIVERVRPGFGPLPQVYDGEMTTEDPSAYADRTTAAFAHLELPGSGDPDS